MFDELEGNIFGELGIFGDVMVPIMGEKEKKKKTEKKKSASNKTKMVYKSPLKIIFDSIDSIDILEEKDFSKEELLEEISKVTEFHIFKENTSEFTLNKLKEGVYLLRPGYNSKYEKGTAGKKLLLEHLYDLETIIEEDESGNITAEMVKAFILENYGMNVNLHLLGDVYIPEAYKAKPIELEKFTFPVKIAAMTLFGETLEIKEDDYIALINEEEQTGLEDEKDSKVSDYGIMKLIKTLLPEYAEDLEYAYIPERGLLQVMHKSLNSVGINNISSAKKEDTYPTNAVVSLVFTRMELSSELFDGKSEITKKELLRYVSKQYPEYSPERTEITYDKKKNLIIPILKSGKRGTYSLDDTELYRKEDTVIMSITALKERPDVFGCVNGLVYFNLPKIPFKILREIVHFFWDVYVCKGTEAIAQIFYKKNPGKYEVYIPNQRAAIGCVEFERDPERETDPSSILVMEIHSHGNFKAQWSEVDNREELAHRLYAVVGNLNNFKYDNNHIRVRAATGGYFVQMEAQEVFELPSKF